MFNRRALIAAIALSVIIVAPPAYAQDKSIVVASTTSTQDSGLFEYLLPIFKEKTGITVKVLGAYTSFSKKPIVGGKLTRQASCFLESRSLASVTARAQ